MKLYKLPLVIHEPTEETEDKYMAEVSALPGCRAWGDTTTEVMEDLQSVAAGFIDSYKSSGDPLLPDGRDEPREDRIVACLEPTPTVSPCRQTAARGCSRLSSFHILPAVHQ